MMSIRGIEHIGITVSNLAEAEKFFINALDASVLYRLVPPEDPDATMEGKDIHSVNGFPPEMKVTGVAMLRLANGCNVELFQTSPETANGRQDISHAGVNHFSMYVDDIHAAGERMKKHGAEMYDGPNDAFSQEEGKGNQTWFCRAPFGALIELITLPSPLHYDAEATEKRWIPAKSS
ncbi:VOC family protein [Erwinia sp. BNK-24-b]|uniref:VOC family protein n=1 Tax=Erwinia TaxID=551 RepID=UPI001FED69E9|nr:VOC family protein [Erwinia phyllosphaerae]